MKMIDYPYQGKYTGGKYRSEVQAKYLGLDTNDAGILASYMEDPFGYPDTYIRNPDTGEYYNLESLYVNVQGMEGDQEVNRNADKVNHLFLLSTYHESGYFEYDSTQNFATLRNEAGSDGENFVVYEQLGSNYGKKHGMFMPYNHLNGNKWTQVNETDLMDQTLSDLDPRKGEKMYSITNTTPGNNKMPNYANNDADYFFGMEMQTSFMQTPDGLDNWGHDMIFEFSGDDDFWLYVDGRLMLDLGGVHSASAGTINFRTGDVKMKLRNASLQDLPERTRDTNLRELFKESYIQQNPRDVNETEDEYNARVNNWLKTIFVSEGDDIGTVFKDYTSHALRIFYMERGASSSNLHMRFNLAPVKPGEVKLTKKVTGTDKQDYMGARFYYQVWYRDTEREEFKLADKDMITVSDVNIDDIYKEHHTINNVRYDNVFYLTHGQSAVIHLPHDDTEYKIKECGVSTSIYDSVIANHDEIVGETPEDGTRDYMDYPIDAATATDRREVVYENHVNDAHLNNLNITKRIYDFDGVLIPTENGDHKTLFRFTVRLRGLDDDSSEYGPVYVGEYFVKDEAGHYCYYDYDERSFVPSGTTDFNSLSTIPMPTVQDPSRTLLDAATFHASLNNGKIDIPAGYTVEIRNLPTGMHFYVNETDIPEGYALWKYSREDGSYIEEDEAPNIGYIRDNNNTPHVLIKNKQGWGLTVKKVWSDAERTHDPIFVAVYAGGEFLPDTIRSITAETAQFSLYYYFNMLKEGCAFADYKVYEVFLTGEYTINEDGSVTVDDVDEVTPIPGNEGDENSLKVIQVRSELVLDNGTSTDPQNYDYYVTYERGTPTGENQNVRTDTVMNTRPGVRLIKTGLDNTFLGGTVFKLERDPYEGEILPEGQSRILIDTIISDAEQGGLIDYISEPGVYYLTEIKAPDGWQTISGELKITISTEDSEESSGTTPHFNVEVSPEDQKDIGYKIKEGSDGMVTFEVAMLNRPYPLRVYKFDASKDPPVAMVNAAFSLYRDTGDRWELVTDNNQSFSELVPTGNGLISQITEKIGPGMYKLVELSESLPYDYAQMPDAIFTISDTGEITLYDTDGTTPLQFRDADAGTTDLGTDGRKMTFTDNTTTKARRFEILLYNYKLERRIRIVKVTGSADANGTPLSGAVFDLLGTGSETGTQYKNLISQDNGVLRCTLPDETSVTLFSLKPGIYSLTETDAPDGYNLLTGAVTITVLPEHNSQGEVTYSQPDHLGGRTIQASCETVDGITVYTLYVLNNSGVQLPATGGPGSAVFLVSGSMLTGSAAVLALREMKRRRCRKEN